MRSHSFLGAVSCSLFVASSFGQGISQSQLEKHVDSLSLTSSFNPVIPAYWSGLPHHRRTPFAVSPDGTAGYVAYLDHSGADVHVQQIDPTSFQATGETVTVPGAKEAGGLVAHDDGFALLTTEPLPAGTENAPADSTPVPVLYRFADGAQTWKTFLGGPTVETNSGHMASPDLNGDLVFSESSGYYAAYFVVTAYDGAANGHFGDSIKYVTADGTLETISGASSDWGCSHNTGIALEAADEPPFASICAEDQGAIWLNTKGQGMSTVGVKVSNEHVINGASNEPMGGMGGSFSGMARFPGTEEYAFAWVSRGAIDLTLNEWMGAGYTKSANRTNGRRVALASFSDKNTLVGEQATSEVGAESGDDQVNWLTKEGPDCSNAHVAAFDGSTALVTWEEIENPICELDAMGCRGAFSGSFFQLVSSLGEKIGEPLVSMDTYVAGDMVTMSDGRICWPYVNAEWTLDSYTQGSSETSMSFACINTGGSSSPASETAAEAETLEKVPAAAESPEEEAPVGVDSSEQAPATSSPEKTPVADPAEEAPASGSAEETPLADSDSSPEETPGADFPEGEAPAVVEPSTPAASPTPSTPAAVPAQSEPAAAIPNVPAGWPWGSGRGGRGRQW